MDPFFAPLVVVFLGIFHILGGSALGQGVRAALHGSDDFMTLIMSGALIGGLPVIFDWVFLIAQGYVVHGLIGPLLVIVCACVTAFVPLDAYGPALAPAALGSAAFLIGLLSVPLILDRSQEYDFGATDYIFGGCFALGFILIGGVFAWNGFRAILSVSLDQTQAKSGAKGKRARKRKTMSSTINKYWE